LNLQLRYAASVPSRPGNDATPWLDDDQLHEWASVVGLVMALPAALDAQLRRDSDLTSFEYHVLVALDAAPGGALPMSDLAFLAHGSRSRLSHAVSRMEGAGWVERRDCSDAGRRTAAHLTDAGRRKLEEAAPGHVREARRLVVDALTPQQLALLGEAARTVLSVVEPEMARRLRSMPSRGSEAQDRPPPAQRS
jgi:DNA-binding MarR family transcriptional regulator